jgi:hypothetical protein
VDSQSTEKLDSSMRVAEINHRAARTTARASIIAALCGLAGITLGAAATAGWLQKQDATVPSARDVLEVRSLPQQGMTLGRDTLYVNLNGVLNEDLPSGKVVWSAIRASSGEGDSGSPDGPAFQVARLCPVSGKTFDCGPHQIGATESEPGTFFLYVGLADSSASRQMVDIMVDQLLNNNFAHPKPGGYDAADPIRIVRR